MPCDSIWLDIEYTEEKKYFTWDKKTFPNAKEMLEKIMNNKRKLVTIIDPHIKDQQGYFVYDEMVKKKLAVLNEKGEPYVAPCWPVSSVWMDFMNKDCRDYLA